MKRIIIIGCCLLLSFSIQLHAQKKKKTGIKSLLGVYVDETSDKFEGSTTYAMKGNKVKIKGSASSSLIKGAVSFFSKRKNLQVSIVTTRLNLEHHIVKDSISELFVILKISVDDDAGFKVMDGESLIFLADGQRIGLSTDGSFNNDSYMSGSSSGISFSSKTHARYAITRQQLKQIINAETVDFRIMQDWFDHGTAQARDKKGSSFEGVFAKKNFKAWNNFYQNYIINISKN